MTGILVALLVIVTAALCFLLGTIYGVAAANEAEKKKREEALKHILNFNKEKGV